MVSALQSASQLHKVQQDLPETPYGYDLDGFEAESDERPEPFEKGAFEAATAFEATTVNGSSYGMKGFDSELTHGIDSRTFRQVRNLQVVRVDGRVILNGSSPSYYVKQLATHAAFDLVPGTAIENAIFVTR